MTIHLQLLSLFLLLLTTTVSASECKDVMAISDKWYAVSKDGKKTEIEISGDEINGSITEGIRSRMSCSGEIDSSCQASIGCSNNFANLRFLGKFPNLEMTIYPHNHFGGPPIKVPDIEFIPEGTVIAYQEKKTTLAQQPRTFNIPDPIPPKIKIAKELRTDTPLATLEGLVESDNKIIQLTINGHPVAINANGAFSTKRGVNVGETMLTLETIDELGNTAKEIVRIIRSPNTGSSSIYNTSTPATPDSPEQAIVFEISDNVETKKAIVNLEGNVNAENRIIELTINNLSVPIESDGTFIIKRGVTPGQSEFKFVAVDELGNIGQKTVTVVRTEPPKPAAIKPPFKVGKYHALVIGNNDYEHIPKLLTAVNDAQVLAGVLEERYGFNVELLLDATRRDIFKAFSRLRGSLKRDDNLLIYYAGHGNIDTVTERGYWLPVEAEEDFQADWISTSDISDTLKSIDANHIMVIADSCYSGTLLRSAPSTFNLMGDRNALLKRLAKKRSRTVMTSGGLEPVVDGGGGGHSVFARALINVLKDANEITEGQRLFEKIRTKVVTNADQTPNYSDARKTGHDGGDFIFVPKL